MNVWLPDSERDQNRRIEYYIFGHTSRRSQDVEKSLSVKMF